MKRGDVDVENPFMFDPFEVLGLEKCYSLDIKVLEKRYFEEQRKSHPDQFVLANPDEKARALRKSTELNQAYLLLKDPLQRASFLLKDKNIELLSHDAETLGKVMMWNERFESGEDLTTELATENEALFKNVEEGFESGDFEKVRVALYLQTYIQKLLKEMKSRVKAK